MTGTRRWCKWVGPDLELRVLVQTRCRDEGLAQATEDGLRVRVDAPPVEGKANKRLALVLAEAFGVARTRVRLVRGERSRHKWFRIERPEKVPGELSRALERPAGLTKRENPSNKR